MIEGAASATEPGKLGRHVGLSVRDYWTGWQDRFDYAIELSFGAQPDLPKSLKRVTEGRFFNIYRIERE